MGQVCVGTEACNEGETQASKWFRSFQGDVSQKAEAGSCPKSPEEGVSMSRALCNDAFITMSSCTNTLCGVRWIKNGMPCVYYQTRYPTVSMLICPVSPMCIRANRDSEENCWLSCVRDIDIVSGSGNIEGIIPTDSGCISVDVGVGNVVGRRHVTERHVTERRYVWEAGHVLSYPLSCIAGSSPFLSRWLWL